MGRRERCGGARKSAGVRAFDASTRRTPAAAPLSFAPPSSGCSHTGAAARLAPAGRAADAAPSSGARAALVRDDLSEADSMPHTADRTSGGSARGKARTVAPMAARHRGSSAEAPGEAEWGAGARSATLRRRRLGGAVRGFERARAPAAHRRLSRRASGPRPSPATPAPRGRRRGPARSGRRPPLQSGSPPRQGRATRRRRRPRRGLRAAG